MLFLLQDGITNGAIYALLGLALVLVFAVTRVILLPQGEFVTYGALTYASLMSGQMPGTAKLAVAMGVAAFAFDLYAARGEFRSAQVHSKLDAETVRRLLDDLIEKLTELEDDSQPLQSITIAFHPAIEQAETD